MLINRLFPASHHLIRFILGLAIGGLLLSPATPGWLPSLIFAAIGLPCIALHSRLQNQNNRDVIRYQGQSAGQNVPWSRERFNRTIEAFGQGFIITDTESRVQYINPAMTTLTGYTLDELQGQRLYEVLMPPEQWDKMRQRSLSRMAGQHTVYDTEVHCKDGLRKWLRLNTSPLLDEDGSVMGTVGIISDVTIHRRAINTLREREARLRVIMEGLPVVLFTLDQDGIFTLSEGKGLQLLGLKSGEILGTSVFERYQDFSDMLDDVRRALNGQMFESTSTIGNLVFETAYSPLHDEQGQQIGIIGVAMNVTQREQAQHDLLLSNARKNAILKAAIDAIITFDPHGYIVEFNPAAQRMFGHRAPDAIGKPIMMLFAPSQAYVVGITGLTDFSDTGTLPTMGRRVEVIAQRADDSTFPAELAITPFKIDGQYMFTAYIQNISERKQAEEERNHLLENMRFLNRTAVELLALRDETGIFTYIGQQLSQLLSDAVIIVNHPSDDGQHVIVHDIYGLTGTTAEKVLNNLGYTPVGRSFPADADIQARYARNKLQTLEGGLATLARGHISGMVIKQITRLLNINDVYFIGLTGLDHDAVLYAGVQIITRNEQAIDHPELIEAFIQQASIALQRVQAVASLVASELRYRSLFEQSTDAVFILNTEGQHIQVNQRAADMLGYTRDQIIGMNYRDIIAESEFNKSSDILKKLLAGEVVPPHERIFRHKDGSTFPVEINVELVRDEHGTPLHLQSMVRDITERKQAEAERERLIAILNTSRDLISLASLKGRVLYMNPAGIEMLGYDDESEIVNQPIRAFHPDDYIQVIEQEGIPTAFERGTWQGEGVLKRRDGGLIPTEQTIFIIQDELGHPAMIATIIKDATERKATEQALLLRNRAIESSASSIIIVAASYPQLPIIYANSAFQVLTGYTPTEILHQPFGFVLPDEPGYAPVHHLNTAFQEGTDCQVITRALRKDGEHFYAEIRLSPVTDQADNVTHFIGIMEDITKRREAEKALAEARDQALEASRLKSEFLATMSHEIRTPLNGVIGMNELLMTTPLDDEQREFAGIAFQEAHNLLNIINDILDFSKIEAGKIILDTVEFQPREMVEDVAELFIAKAREKNIALMTYIAPSVPRTLLGDKMRIRQVLSNLVSNAIKFTHEGEVTIQVTLEESVDPTHKNVNFSVSDTGIGLSPVAHQRLFEPFTQADGSTTRQYGGTGLGLAICKRLVEFMGGTIAVNSHLGEGSTFWFTLSLPIAEVDQEAEPTPPVNNLKGLRVLIVDDNTTQRRILARYLEYWQMVSRSVTDGQEALEELRRAAAHGTAYDLVLLDRVMPEMDGLRVAECIRAEGELAHTRLILLTAFDERGLGDYALTVGMDAYLTKPIRQAHLFDVIAQIVASRNNSAEAAPKAPQAATGESADAAIPKQRLRILLAEDNRANREVAQRQLIRLGYDVELVHDGQQAVDAIRADRNRYDLILMDCQMPNMDGFEATRLIRQLPSVQQQHLPIVAMTANAMKGDREQCLTVGMDDYISKPVTLGVLQDVLATWLKKTTA